jgi:hypothetical protein
MALQFSQKTHPMAAAGLPVSRQKRQWSFPWLRRADIEILWEDGDPVVSLIPICLPGEIAWG